MQEDEEEEESAGRRTPGSLRPAARALTLFDMEPQRWQRQREAETGPRRGRHQSRGASGATGNVRHATEGPLVPASIALLRSRTFISFKGRTLLTPPFERRGDPEQQSREVSSGF